MRRVRVVGLLAAAIALGLPRPSSEACAQPVSAPFPLVVAQKNTIRTTYWTGVNQSVTVVLDGLKQWSEAAPGTNDPARLRLFLAGQILEHAEPILINREQDYVNFRLRIDRADRSEWVAVLTAARQSHDHTIPISVGLAGTRQPFESTLYVRLNLYPSYTRYVVIGLIVLLGALILLAAKTDLLRAEGNSRTGRPRPFSLGYVQMAWWVYLVVAGYLYIWLITGEYDTLTTDVLALIGISATTGLASTFVEAGKRRSVVDARAAREIDELALRTRIAEIQAVNPAPGSALETEMREKQSALARVAAELAVTPAAPPAAASRNFIIDLLSDAEGVRFHRFQIVLWTIVLGVIFVRVVHDELAMPAFGATLLGLMGISSGTYIGFKVPEKPK